MKVVQPITITPAMLVESNLFETAPATYAAGTTYALGAYASVAGTLGEILIYKSLQAGNIGHTPSSSPTWWVYTSSTYQEYIGIMFGAYPLGERVFDPLTKSIYENIVPDNSSHPLDPIENPTWLSVGTSTAVLPPQWLVGTTYALDALVTLIFTGVDANGIPVTTYQKVFKSIQASNTGHFPNPALGWWVELVTYPVPYYFECTYDYGQVVKDTDNRTYKCLQSASRNVLLTNPAGWLKISPSNTTALFDTQTQTKTTANKEISVTVATGIIDTVGLIGVDADLAVITVRDGLGGTIVFQKTIGLTGGNPTNAWDYYFSEPTLRTTQTIIEGIPPYVNSHVTVVLTGSGTISIGNLIFGKAKEIGLAEYGATAGILDFSGKTTDAFGLTTFVQRGYKKTVSLRSFVENSKLNVIQNTLYAIRATPCLWIGSSDTRLSESLVVFGFYKDFNTEIPYPEHSYISIEIEGLI